MRNSNALASIFSINYCLLINIDIRFVTVAELWIYDCFCCLKSVYRNREYKGCISAIPQYCTCAVNLDDTTPSTYNLLYVTHINKYSALILVYPEIIIFRVSDVFWVINVMTWHTVLKHLIRVAYFLLQ